MSARFSCVCLDLPCLAAYAFRIQQAFTVRSKFDMDEHFVAKKTKIMLVKCLSHVLEVTLDITTNLRRSYI